MSSSSALNTDVAPVPNSDSETSSFMVFVECRVPTIKMLMSVLTPALAIDDVRIVTVYRAKQPMCDFLF